LSRILLLDLETSHNLILAFQLFNKQPLPHSAILKERYIIMAGWQWYGEQAVHTAVARRPWHDKAVIKEVIRQVRQADAVVAHNGKRFDFPYLRTRAIREGLSVPPLLEIDTLQLARSRFRFNNNRLDYLGQYLGLGRKQHTNADLWHQVVVGDKDALAEMEAYLKQDVRLLGKVFAALYPYLSPSICRQLFGKVKCRTCGSRHLQKRGKQVARDRYQCQECGTWTSQPTKPISTPR